ncbi:hypothetical protein B0J17DRAFT_631377 [Rhizoctonia solani]|nr:hypothetical protein B0J17DRAFT_631377 [Rhizoctonia solani]
MKLERCLDDGVNGPPGHHELAKLFEGLHNVLCLQELHVRFLFQPEEGGRPVNLYNSIEKTGPDASLECIHIDGMRIGKEFRHSLPRLASIWPNVRTLSMPSQHASLKGLEHSGTLPSFRHLIVKLNLACPYPLTKPGFERAPLETLTSSGPVRLSTVYKDLSLSAHVTWSDKDPARLQMADLFGSQILRFNREFLYGGPREVARPATTKTAREMKVPFKLILEKLEEVDSDSDTDPDTEEGVGSE